MKNENESLDECYWEYLMKQAIAYEKDTNIKNKKVTEKENE